MGDLRGFDADGQLAKYTAKAKSSDVERVLEQREKIFSKAKRGPLAKALGSLRELIALVAAYANGSYRAVPWSTIAAAVGCLVYVLSPLDFIPDFVPGVGLIDDAAVLAAAVKLIGRDLAAFRAWKDDPN